MPSPDETPQVPALRREVERPSPGGNGLLPMVVLAAAMTSTLAAAALAMSLTPRSRHCPRYGQQSAPVVAPPVEASFARPAAPAPELVPAPLVIVPRVDPACAPRVHRSSGDMQEWTYEICASAPDPSPILLRAP